MIPSASQAPPNATKQHNLGGFETSLATIASVIQETHIGIDELAQELAIINLLTSVEIENTRR
jgi:hypothetical protein